MRLRRAGGLAGLVLWCVSSCTAPQPAPTPSGTEPPSAESPTTEAPSPEGATEQGAGGGASAEENLTPAQLTGVPGIDQAQNLVVKILDARGTGRVGGNPLSAGKTGAVPPGQWMLTDPGSEYEITLRSTVLPDGIVRLAGPSAFLVEAPTEKATPGFRVFAGTAAFYLPNLPLGETTVLTPAGPLVTHGAVFTVAVAPDGQVLVTCREGAVFLTGSQNTVAQPGQVFVADRLGRGRVYDMTPGEAQVFADRWLQVMSEGARPVLSATLPRRLAAWRTLDLRVQVEEARFLALWFRQARLILGEAVPGSDTWGWVLDEPVRPSPWRLPLAAPGLLGELP